MSYQLSVTGHRSCGMRNANQLCVTGEDQTSELEALMQIA